MLPWSPIQGLATMWSPIPATKRSCQHVIHATHAQIFLPNIKEWGGEMQSYHFHGSKRKVRIFVNKPNDHHESSAILLLPMLSCLCIRSLQNVGKITTSLVVWWLSLCTPNARVWGSILGQGAKSHMPQLNSACHNLKMIWHSQINNFF